jgi:D-sedoheptulose 7-phosphate isomerase
MKAVLPMKDVVMNQLATYISSLQATMSQLSIEQIARVVEILRDARLNGRQVFIMGNGGSASTATHFVCDLAKNTRRTGLPHFRVIGLTDNMAIFSAYANDEGYERVFEAQLDNLINRDDIVIGISASGNSKNVLNAMNLARQRNAVTVGFTGFDGGSLKPLVDVNIHVESHVIEHVEDIHLMLEHMIVKTLKEDVSSELVVRKAVASVDAGAG